jgi:hypothetical protein
MVPLNTEPLLSFRDRVLRDHDIDQRRVLDRHPKRKSTEETRRKQEDDYKSALIRKQQRKERGLAIRSNHQAKKLNKIEQRFIKSQELGYARLNQVKEQMREEQEIFYRQRAEILKETFHPTVEKLFFITILALSSPLC